MLRRVVVLLLGVLSCGYVIDDLAMAVTGIEGSLGALPYGSAVEPHQQALLEDSINLLKTILERCREMDRAEADPAATFRCYTLVHRVSEVLCHVEPTKGRCDAQPSTAFMVGEMRGYQQHFTAEALKPLVNATLEKSPFPDMIFIVGMMRSGSTLAESMLDRLSRPPPVWPKGLGCPSSSAERSGFALLPP